MRLREEGKKKSDGDGEKSKMREAKGQEKGEKESKRENEQEVKQAVAQKERNNGEPQERKQEGSSEGKGKAKASFFVSESEVKSVMITRQKLLVLLYKDAYFFANEINHSFSSVISLLQGYGVANVAKTPSGLPLEKNGIGRICITYQTIDKIIVKYQHSILRLDYVFEELHGPYVFLKLDLKFRYHKMKMRDKDKWKTTFTFKHGLYKWLIILFGLTNTLSTFMRLLNLVLCAFNWKFIVHYYFCINNVMFLSFIIQAQDHNCNIIKDRLCFAH